MATLMRIEMKRGIVHVTLSEGNLKVLLAKLGGSPIGSACTISYDTRDGLVLFVSAEPDTMHYANPERDSPVPGAMHPDTEKRLRKVGQP